MSKYLLCERCVHWLGGCTVHPLRKPPVIEGWESPMYHCVDFENGGAHAVCKQGK